MINITDLAGQELNKVLQSDEHTGKRLFVSFMGYG
jgi:hypothetical protein